MSRMREDDKLGYRQFIREQTIVLQQAACTVYSMLFLLAVLRIYIQILGNIFPSIGPMLG
jgi:hypothetical protein